MGGFVWMTSQAMYGYGTRDTDYGPDFEVCLISWSVEALEHVRCFGVNAR